MIKSMFLIFLGIGVGFLAAAGIIAYFQYGFLNRAVRTEGTVTGFVTSSSRHGHVIYPVVEFTGRDGQKHSFRNFVGFSPNPYRKGDMVKVLYDPAKPEGASIESFFSLWLLPFIFGLIGAIFTFVGVLLWRLLSSAKA